MIIFFVLVRLVTNFKNKEQTLKKYFSFIAIQAALFVGTATAAPLPEESAEYKQLEAMGYELRLSSNGSLTVADLGETRIVFRKTDSGYTVFRLFKADKKLNDREYFEVLEIVNKMNLDNTYQVSYTKDEYLTVALYVYGDTDAKTFAKVVRSIEASRYLFDANQRLLDLLE